MIVKNVSMRVVMITQPNQLIAKNCSGMWIDMYPLRKKCKSDLENHRRGNEGSFSLQLTCSGRIPSLVSTKESCSDYADFVDFQLINVFVSSGKPPHFKPVNDLYF